MGNSTENDCYITPSTSFNGDVENENEKKLFWVPDEEVTNCYSCNVFFNVRIRKHHCRACGNVFCSNCSDNKLKISEYYYAEKVRVCDRCFIERSSPQTLLLQEDLGARKQINQDLKKALSEKMAIVERFKTFLIEFDSEILNNNNYQEDSTDVISLLKRGEKGLKILNDKIKNYDTVIEKQKNELEQLKKEKEQKIELNKILNLKNQEILQKNMNIKNLLKEKNDLILVKEESEDIIELYKKQVEKLIIRCNKLEMEKKSRSKSENNNYSFTKTSNATSSSYFQNSYSTPQNEMCLSYTVADGPSENVEENCCNRCQRRICFIM
ncbi:FYVE and coiled-coil domain-containing protein, putative [Plasmodium gallinaceum]|uniref:FYVE and coiled-coil domain-containing protein, putative n=1 Tax=Plasmodium gallinaceum TaxID=5849 RepID=A0A1J1GQH7_PLAGA|nr:FYVE and coiled-coil domain-containing protein, putative [Plasmodium gallinaceum]CRG94797.1 FYVE and coiled-coil domain-containing protein, putative [Plasmodium gallinaceum]